MEFKGCRALVTGASSGMGEVFARELARRGADLVLAARSRGKLEELASELRASAHVTVHVEVADLSEPGAGQALADRLAEQDLRIDVLVNNAGFGLFGPLHEADGRRMDPAEVVAAALSGLDHRRSTVVPGLGNRLLAGSSRLAPRQTVARLAERRMRSGLPG
jgi:short-subunit dehydrogenase